MILELKMRMLAACIFLWGVSVPDLRSRTVPAQAPAVFAAGAVLLDLAFPSPVGTTFLLTGFLPGMCLLAISALGRHSVGAGDGLCLLACGSWIGPEMAAELLVLSAVLAGAYGAVCLLLLGKPKDSTFAFLPFLAAGQSICLLWAVCRSGTAVLTVIS